MCPKIHTEKKEYESPEEVQVLKILISTGDSYFKIQSLKVGINRQPFPFSLPLFCCCQRVNFKISCLRTM